MIIAEIGLNHLGSEEYLMKYIDCLIESPVDAITLQIREKSFYKNKMYSHLKLSKQTYDKAILKIKKSKKKFGLAGSDLSFLSLFREEVDFYKILSKDIDNNNIIDNLINKDNKPVFVSTGMSSYDTIFSFLKKIKKSKLKNLNLIHTRLSNKIEDTNLKAIQKMKENFHLPIAYGNHCEKIIVTYAAIAFEPSDIFIYVKGNMSKNHPDENHAIFLDDIADFSKNIKLISKSIGTGKKEKTHNKIKGQI